MGADTTPSSRMTRRSFLAGAATVPAATGAPGRQHAARRPRYSPEEFKDRVRGIVFTMPTPFTSKFAVDYAAVRRMVDLGVSNGIRIFELTAGNSMFDWLEYGEIKQLTRSLVEIVAGRGVVIAATGPWWTGQAVDFARFAADTGADALQVLLPDGYEGGYVEHFRALAGATPLPLVLQGQLDFSLMDQLIRIPAIVSMKEDGTDQYYPEVTRRFGHRLAIFCGGQLRRYLLGQPYGSPAFFGFFDSFAPQVEVGFWSDLQRGDLAAARRTVDRFETPLFKLCLAGPESFAAYWRALLEIYGVASRWVRPPLQSCTDRDVARTRALCTSLGLAPPGSDAHSERSDAYDVEPASIAPATSPHGLAGHCGTGARCA